MRFFRRLSLLLFLLVVVLSICSHFAAKPEIQHPTKVNLAQESSLEKFAPTIDTDPAKLTIIKLLYLTLLLGVIFGLIVDLNFIIGSVKSRTLGISGKFANSNINLNYFFKVFAAIILTYLIFRFLRIRLLSLFPLSETFILLTLDALFKIFSCFLIFSTFSSKSFGLNFKNIQHYPRLIIKSYVGLMPLLTLVVSVNFFIFHSLNIQSEPMKAITLIMKEKSIVNLCIWFIEAVIIAPIFEEFIFRGLIYGSLRKRFSFGLSALFSAVFFSLLHNNIFYFLPILTLGTFFSYAYERTKNILAPMCLHTLHNFLIFIILILYKIYLI